MARKPIRIKSSPLRSKTLQLPPVLEGFVKAHSHALVRWLTALIAFLVLVWIAQLASAETTDFSQTITPAPDSITVTVPNGGESWTVGTSQNITWDTTGTVDNVLIEIQRVPAGAWTTIIASTPDDGSYPWTVDGSATTDALIRITDVLDAGVTDTSDAVFSIVAAAEETPGGTTGGGSAPLPVIDNLYYTRTGELIVPGVPVYSDYDNYITLYGRHFLTNAFVSLGNYPLATRYISATQLEFVIPAGFSTGSYQVSVTNSTNRTGVWGQRITITRSPAIVEEPTAGGTYSAKLLGKSPSITMNPGDTVTVWAEFENVGTLAWHSGGSAPVRLGTTHPMDRESLFVDPSWISESRPTAVATVSGTIPATINPGDKGRFAFVFRAPQTPGKYREYFGLVAEGHSWFWDDNLSWDILVGDANLNLRDVVSTPIPRDADGNPLPIPDSTKPIFGPPAYADTGDWDWLVGTANFLGDLLLTYWYWLVLLVALYLWLRSKRKQLYPSITQRRKKKKTR